MAKIELAPEVGDDIDQILDHLAQSEIEDAPLRILAITQAINVLEYNPLIGQPVDGNKRQLVIGRRSRGYIALYRYVVEIDTVFVLALRSQREAGYS
ncbi:type II toxin-antitoxin system RelE/ParE family toxin [Sulfuriferula nivalis]|uniref:Plasmid stabilization protein n=1 Tax=Sulfuriferula nivalis TaxID=2675298 RepID=A0A809RCM6_9PROT|nr:type II toxin-antitoxin system RelE/ParE family toxin [Sulfuriferula nivalis]BBO99508.1 plasmid stabilization protein [Sulfuriferula nivalis]